MAISYCGVGTIRGWSGRGLLAAGLAVLVGCQSQRPSDEQLGGAIEQFRMRAEAANVRPAAAASERPYVLGDLAMSGAPNSPAMLGVVGQAEAPAPSPAFDADGLPAGRSATDRFAGGFWHTVGRDIKAMPRDLWSDTKATYWNKTNALILLVGGGASAALRPEVDDDIEDKYDRSRTLKSDWGDAFGAAGNPATHFGFAMSAYAYSVLAKDVKNYERAKTLISALIINGTSTLVLQISANTHSPNGEQFGWPSGHTSSTMTVAAVLDEYYGPLVGIPLYGLTGMVALERMDDGEHHFSDVVFGAVLGYVVGKTVVRNHKPMLLGGEITPYINEDTGASGIAWVKQF